MDKMEEKHMGGAGKTCNCPHHKVIPTLVVIIGFDFLLGALNILNAWFVAVTWPIIVILAGGTMFGSQSCGCCSK